MNPLDLLDELGKLAGGAVGAVAGGVLEPLMAATWSAALFILRTAFELVDQFSLFTVSTMDGPVSILWPMTLWISGAIALGLFFWQIITAVLHGGRGFVRLIVGPVQYGIALAVTVGVVAACLAAADGLTEAILSTGLRVGNFRDALNMTGFTDALSDEVKNVVLGLAGAFGVIPAGLGFAVEAVFREAAIYVVVATVPIAAAGLLADATARWYWKCVRWGLVAVVMKPALAFVVVLAVAIVGGAQGLSGLLAGIGVLFVALCVPLVLFKLFAFVDQDADPQGVFRDKLSDAGLDSYGANSFAGRMASAYRKKVGKEFGGKEDSDEEGGDSQEQANVDRFDQAAAVDDAAVGPPEDGHASGGNDVAGSSGDGSSGDGAADADSSRPGGDDRGTGLGTEAADSAAGDADGAGGADGGGGASAAGPVDDSDGDGQPPAEPPGDTGPPTPPTPKPSGGPPDDGGGAAAGEAEEAAVLL